MTTSNQAGTATPGPYEAARSGTDPKWWTLAAVCLGTFMLLLDITIVNVALPDIQSSLGASFSDLQWVIDAYALTLAALLLTTGSLADLYGRRRLYLAGLFVFTAASALCGHVLGLAGPFGQRLPWQGPRRGLRHLGRPHRGRCGHRPHRRWRTGNRC